MNAIAEDGTLDGGHSQNEGINSEGHAADNYFMDSDATSPSFDVVATLHTDHGPADARHDSSNETPPLVQHEPRCHSNFMQNDEKNCDFADIDASDCDSSAYLFDDESSASSAIGALACWNKPVSSNSGRSSDSDILGKASSHSGSREDDMEEWSNDEDESISTSVGGNWRGARAAYHRESNPGTRILRQKTMRASFRLNWSNC